MSPDISRFVIEATFVGTMGGARKALLGVRQGFILRQDSPALHIVSSSDQLAAELDGKEIVFLLTRPRDQAPQTYNLTSVGKPDGNTPLEIEPLNVLRKALHETPDTSPDLPSTPFVPDGNFRDLQGPLAESILGLGREIKRLTVNLEFGEDGLRFIYPIIRIGHADSPDKALQWEKLSKGSRLALVKQDDTFDVYWDSSDTSDDIHGPPGNDTVQQTCATLRALGYHKKANAAGCPLM